MERNIEYLEDYIVITHKNGSASIISKYSKEYKTTILTDTKYF